MKKLFLVLISSSLFFSCLKQGNQDNQTSNSTKNNSKSKASGFGEDAKPITLSAWYLKDVVPFPNGEDFAHNRWLDAVKKDLNIDYKILFAAAGSDYNTKVNASISTGDLADFMTLPAMTFFKMMKGGYLEDLTPSYEKYASPELKRFLSINNGKFKQGKLMDDGKLYGIGEPGKYEDMIIGYVRKNWLDNLGLQIPKTYDDLEKVAKAFVTQDPNKTGVADTSGIALDNDIFWTWSPFFSYFDSYPYFLTKEGDKIIWGGRSEKAKQALVYMRHLNEEGLFNKEFYTKTIWGETPVIKDNTGIYFSGAWAPYMFANETYKIDKTQWTHFILRKNGKAVVNKLSLGFSMPPKAVRKGYNHPEKAIQLISYLIEQFNNTLGWANFKINPEDDFWQEGSRVLRNYGFMEGPDSIYRASEDIWKVLSGEAKEDSLKGRALVGYQSYKKYLKGNKTHITEYELFNNKDGSYKTFDTLMKEHANVYEDYNGPPTDSFINYKDQIQTKMMEIFTNIIIGNVDFEKGWQEWLDYFEHNHGPEMEKEANDWVSKKQ